MRLKLLVPVLTAIALVLPAVAHAGPPANARALSEILSQLETGGDVAWFDEVEWDDDGYWEIEYVRADGARVELRVDPVTGEPLR